MIVQLRVPDELYELYAKRNPGDPRAAMAEALEAFKGLEPGVPRLVVENPELRELKRLSQEALDTAPGLVAWAKKNAGVSVGGIEVELSLGQRQRLEAQADFLKQPFDGFAKQQISAALFKVMGV